MRDEVVHSVHSSYPPNVILKQGHLQEFGSPGENAKWRPKMKIACIIRLRYTFTQLHVELND